MRRGIGTALVMVALVGCGDRAEKRATADARAAGFVPPSVTSRLDWGGIVERRFRTLDRDGDDAISATEMPRQNAARLASFDRNKDGRVTAIEYSEGQLARFDRTDLNRDGTVTSEEIEAARAGRR